MNTKFTLKNVVDFMEAQGFHVREAREIEGIKIFKPCGSADKQSPERKIEAIEIEIAPKAKD
ncbi:MAG: hypothetical protein LBH43_15680 [Treponema sp.]|jgi:DUF1009 family protein|nr:hypothetical protein [Treponema sp.]